MIQKIPDEVPRRPQWTSTLLTFQRLQLKMAYKNKTKLRARIMKQIRRKVRKVQSTSFNQMRLLSMLQYKQFDTTQAFMDNQGAYHEKSTLHQCMNALRPEPPKPKKKKGLKLRIRVAVQKPKKRKLNFPTVTVPGTTEGETTAQEVQAQEPKEEKGIDDDLDLYYKVYNRYKPEVGESNAESAARTTALEAEYQYLLMKKNAGRENVKVKRQRATKLHYLSPITPPNKRDIEIQGDDKIFTERTQQEQRTGNLD